MNLKFIKRHLFFIIVLILVIIPKTRLQLQIILHKGISFINPVSQIDKDERQVLNDYDFQLYDENGNGFNLERAKGKVVLINFWATWCAPCIAEMPSLQKLYDEYKDDILFLFITNERKGTIESFKTKYNLSIPIYQRRSKAPKALITRSIPRTLLLNRKGEIVIDKYGAVDWFRQSIKDEINRAIQ